MIEILSSIIDHLELIRTLLAFLACQRATMKYFTKNTIFRSRTSMFTSLRNKSQIELRRENLFRLTGQSSHVGPRYPESLLHLHRPHSQTP